MECFFVDYALIVFNNDNLKNMYIVYTVLVSINSKMAMWLLFIDCRCLKSDKIYNTVSNPLMQYNKLKTYDIS